MKSFCYGMAFAEGLTLLGYFFYAPLFDWLLRLHH